MLYTQSNELDGLTPNQTIVFKEATGTHTVLARPLFNAVHQQFPYASFEVLKTLLTNASYGLHIARQHRIPIMFYGKENAHSFYKKKEKPND